MGRIADTLKQATDYGFPAGMAQAGLQLAQVDVPWLLGYIEELEAKVAGADSEPQPLRTASGL